MEDKGALQTESCLVLRQVIPGRQSSMRTNTSCFLFDKEAPLRVTAPWLQQQKCTESLGQSPPSKAGLVSPSILSPDLQGHALTTVDSGAGFRGLKTRPMDLENSFCTAWLKSHLEFPRQTLRSLLLPSLSPSATINRHLDNAARHLDSDL